MLVNGPAAVLTKAKLDPPGATQNTPLSAPLTRLRAAMLEQDTEEAEDPAPAPAPAPAPGCTRADEVVQVQLADGPVPSGPFRGQDRAAALHSLNTCFASDLKDFIEAAKPDSVDLSSCMRQYLGLAAEVKGT